MTDTAEPTSLLQALAMQDLPPQEQEALLADLHEVIAKHTLLRCIEAMGEDARVTFNALLDSDASEEEVETFLKAHVVNTDAIVSEVVRELTDGILSGTGA